MSGPFRRARLGALTPPAWHWARGAVTLNRERGISLRAYRRSRGARLDLLPPFVELTDGLVVDLGANAGDWTADVIAAVPSARILAVEPYRRAYARVAQRFAGAANVRVDDRAVGATTGSAAFHVAAWDVFGSLLDANPTLEAFYGAGARTTETITVPTVTPDELVAGQPVSVLKVDVQGAELQVFAGGTETLTATRAVLIEANFAPHYRGGAPFSQVHETLTARGFAPGTSRPRFAPTTAASSGPTPYTRVRPRRSRTGCRPGHAPELHRSMRISFLVCDGRIGGAERSAVALAGEIRRLGVEAGVVIVGSVGALAQQLRQESSVPVRALGLRSGHQVLRHPRLLRQAVASQGSDVAVVSSVGFLGVALAAGGFRGGLIGIEHGVLITIPSLDRRRRVVRLVDRAVGVVSHDAEVAVSADMEALARTTLHVPKLVCIPHGVRLAEPPPRPPRPDGRGLTLGYAGRLIPGKGVDVLLRAFAVAVEASPAVDLRLRVAGDGPDGAALRHLANQLGLRERVTLLGWSDDIRGFWELCDLALAPNDHFHRVVLHLRG